jgi:hypothetical protein
MFRHVNRYGSRFLLTDGQHLFARQPKSAFADKSVFDPNNDRVNATLYRIVFVGKMFQCEIGSPVLERNEEAVFDTQFRGRFAATSVKFLEGGLKNFQHLGKSGAFHAEKPFELRVAQG